MATSPGGAGEDYFAGFNVLDAGNLVGVKKIPTLIGRKRNAAALSIRDVLVCKTRGSGCLNDDPHLHWLAVRCYDAGSTACSGPQQFQDFHLHRSTVAPAANVRNGSEADAANLVD